MLIVVSRVSHVIRLPLIIPHVYLVCVFPSVSVGSSVNPTTVFIGLLHCSLCFLVYSVFIVCHSFSLSVSALFVTQCS